MKYAIIISPDPAGQNIKYFLDEMKIKYYEVEKKSIYNEHIDKKIKADMYIFPTTHTSAQGIPALAIHYPGNWGPAELGGKKNTLCITPSSLLRTLYLELKKIYNGTVTLEADHHGPEIEKPTLFIEIGSSKENWEKPELGKIIATALKNCLGKEKVSPTVICLGGGHYPHEFNKILERTEYAVSHICPKHQLQYLNKKMLQQAIKKSVEKIDFAVLDWKGMGKEKSRVLDLLKEIQLPYKKTRDLF